MRFHHHGYIFTNPRVKDAAGVGIDRNPEMPGEVDVMIIGSGLLALSLPPGFLLSPTLMPSS